MQNNPLEQIGKAAKQASYIIAVLSTAQKNALLMKLANLLEAGTKTVLSANAKDMQAAKAANIAEFMLDRLLLSTERIASIASDIRHIVRLEDPIGKILGGGALDSGLRLMRKCVPLGVVAAIYEARPNVTMDIASLCLKTGNAAILRGGKETQHTNAALIDIIQSALQEHGLSAKTVQAVTSPDRVLVNALLQLDAYVDMLIPRGGEGLHNMCRENSRIPVITGGIGVCHIFVDQSARQHAALDVLANAKVQRPSVCNSVETVLVHSAIAAEFLPRLAEHMGRLGVTLHPDVDSSKYLAALKHKFIPLQPGDLDKEWLSLDLNVIVVSDLDSAIRHIREHGTGHSDSILTESMANAERFVQEVDSSAVYVNASTRFTDGGQFGLGAEVAISTQKLHARGPMGLDALTTHKWIAYGDYAVRT